VKFVDNYALTVDQQVAAFKHAFLGHDMDELTAKQIEMAIYKRRLELAMKREERENEIRAGLQSDSAYD
jgi:hypothetical protein